MKKYLYILLLIAAVQGNSFAGTIYVDATATGANDGTSWANAYTTLSAALAAANAHTVADDILIATGTYYPTGDQASTDRDATFGIFRGGIKLHGGYPVGGGMRDLVANAVFLDGGIGTSAATDNSYHVMVIAGIAASADSIVVDGICIKNGTGYINTLNTINGQAVKRSYGGGMSILNVANAGKTCLRHCRIEDNRVKSTWVPSSNPNPTNPFNGFVEPGAGAGIYIKNASPSIAHCSFTNNVAEGSSYGAALSLATTSAVITKCTFTENKSGSTVDCQSYATARFTDCIFNGNGPEMEGWGSAVVSSWMSSNNDLTLIGCLIFGNDGRAIDGAVGTITNCTVTGNTAGYGNNSWPADPVHISNSILYGNSINNIMSTEDNVTVDYSIIGGGHAGTGNMDVNPQFVDAANGDYRLLPSSPAINAGNNAAVPAGITEDLDGNARITGNAVDMGVYEYSGSITPANVSTLEEDNVRTYPNPVSSILYIDCKMPVNAVILTAEGKVLLQQENALTINTNSFPAGVYVITLYNKEGVLAASRRFMKVD